MPRDPADARIRGMTSPILRLTQTVRFMCKACNGTGKSRWFEGRDCDVCEGHGTIKSYVRLGA